MSSEFIRELTIRGDVVVIPRKFESYEYVRTIDSGVAGVVVEVVHPSSGMHFAAKFLNRPDSNTSAMKHLERELRLSTSFSCPFLVKCLHVCYMDTVICLIMELWEGGDLFDRCRRDGLNVRRHWRVIFTQVCLGIRYLHQRGLAHRDVKIENILMDSEFNCKLADYGAIYDTELGDMTASLCGTVTYMSPEVVRGERYCPKKADMWSLGITLFAIWTGCFPWKSGNDAGRVGEILKGVFETEMLPTDVREIVLRCCDPNPKTRATIEEILQRPFVQMPLPRPAKKFQTVSNVRQCKELVQIKPIHRHLSDVTRRMVHTKCRNVNLCVGLTGRPNATFRIT